MMKTIKRPISIILAVMLVVGMFSILPFSASATETEETKTVFFTDSANWGNVTVYYEDNGTWSGKGMNNLYTNGINGGQNVLGATIPASVTKINFSNNNGARTPDITDVVDGGWWYYSTAENAGWAGPTLHPAKEPTFTESGNIKYYDLGKDNQGNDVYINDSLAKIGDPQAVVIPQKTAVAQIGDTNYETLVEAFANVQDSETITLLCSSTGGGIKVLENKFPNGVTVDFAGYTYTVDRTLVGSTGYESQAFHLEKGNTFTFKNGTITSENARMLVQNYSDLTLDNMTLTPNNPSQTNYYTLSNNNGNIVIKDTTINANPTANSFAFDVCRFSSYPEVNVTVTGASVINGDVEISASNGDAKDGFSLTLTSGTMTGDIVVAASAKDLINNGGTVTKKTAFTQEAPEGFRWVGEGETQTLTAIPYVAQIGTTKYETLGAAFAAVQDGQTITLLANSTGGGIKVLENKFPNGVTLDFAGFTYTIDSALVGSPGYESQAFHLEKGNTFTFKNGTITSENARMLVQNYSDLTLDNMTLTPNNPSQTNYYTLSNNNGNIVIKDTTINANPTANSFAFDVCRFSSYPEVNVTVTGASVINGDVQVDAGNGDAKNGFSLTLESGTLTGDIDFTAGAKNAIAKTPEKAEVTKANTFTQTAPADFEWIDNGDGTSTLAAIEYVAQIGDTKYRTLEAAFAAAVDGDTITLLADCAGNGIKVPENKFNNNGLTVDFGGYTYTVDGTTVGSTGTETQGFQLLKGNKITFQNGAITGSSKNTSSLMFLIQNYSDLTLDKMNLSLVGAYYSQYTLSNNNGEIVINDSTINAPDYTWINPSIKPSDVNSFAFDVCRYASYPSVNVTVTGASVINGDVQVDAGNGDAKNGFSLTLESGTMTGNIDFTAGAKNAIATTPEKAEVTKANTFTQAAPEGFEWVNNGDGTSTLKKIPKLFLGRTISLNGYIDLNFYLNPNLVDEGTTVNFAWTVNGTNKTASYTIKENDYDAEKGGYKATVSLPAAEMNYGVTASVEGFDETKTSSVRDYCDELLGITNDPDLINLVKALLNYGAAAQTAFSRTDVDLANKGIDYTGFTYQGDVDDEMIDLAINGKADDLAKIADTKLGAKYYSPSLFYLSATLSDITSLRKHGRALYPMRLLMTATSPTTTTM